MGATILVVDDHRSIADTIVFILNALSGEFAAVAAYSGQQAVEMARSLLPDLVLLDVNLPDTIGLEHALAVRDQCGCKVLLMSGDSRTGEILLESDSGEGDRFEILSKPMHPLELIDRVRNAIRSYSGEANP